jgi:type IV pilus assembly protein PilA
MIRNIQRKIKKSRGFTLVELMIVVAIVGILAALAIYGVRKYMANAKSAEARNSLGQISKDASTAYNREHMAAGIIADGKGAGVSNQLCDKADKSVPELAADIKGQKYQSKASEWDEGTKDKGWLCLKYSMSAPQYYMYGYAATLKTDGTDGSTFTATSQGDLDGDGTLSTFTMKGEVRSQQVVVSPTIDEDKPEE